MNNPTLRQNKIALFLQKELAQFFHLFIQKQPSFKGVLVSVTKVIITRDLSIAKIYISVFPSNKGEVFMELVESKESRIKHKISTLLKNKMRRIPLFKYYLDDSLDYMEKIEKELNTKMTL